MAARLKLAREGADERERLHSLFMQAPVAVAILEGPQHTYTFANPTYRTLLGGRDVVGKPLLEAVMEVQGQGIEALMDREIGRASGRERV